MTTERRNLILMVAAVCAAALFSYANTLQNGFAMDDRYNVVENRQIRSLAEVPRLFAQPVGASSSDSYDRRIGQGFWRPLTLTSYALDYRLWGLNPLGYHLTNVVLHALVCVLLVLVFRRLGTSTLAAGAGGLVFALHPLHTEVVNLVTYRTEILAALWGAWMLLTHLKAGPRRLIDYLWLPLLYACGLASKETAVTLPGWLLVADLASGRLRMAWQRQQALTLLRTYAPLLLVLIAYLALRASLLEPTAIDFFGGLSAGLRFLSVAKIYRLYVQLLLLPWPLVPFYDWTVLAPAVSAWDWQAYLGLLLFGATLGFIALLWSRQRLVAIGLCWWLLGLIPFLHLVTLPVGAAERFLYLPSVGICLALGVGFAWLWRSRRVVAVGVALVLVALMTLGTVVRNTHWRSDLRLQRQAVADFPGSFVAHHNLGLLYEGEGKRLAAIRELVRANEILPNVRPCVVQLIDLLLQQGQATRAAQLLDAAIAELGPAPDLLRLKARARHPVDH